MKVETRDQRLQRGRLAYMFAFANIIEGDRIGATACPGTKRTFTFSHWEGQWMVSRTGLSFHPIAMYAINGVNINAVFTQVRSSKR